jgi:2-iminobutanoate/2-iminopropanoate deaminase
MPKQIIIASSAPTTGFTPGQAVSPLAQAIRFGNMLFVSGQGSLAGATTENIVNMRVILRDVADFPRFNETFRAYFGGEKVTRTCFGGVLHRAGIDVEIDCVAMFD